MTDRVQTNGSMPVPEKICELTFLRNRVAEILEIADKNGQAEIAYHAMALDFAISDALVPTAAEL